MKKSLLFLPFLLLLVGAFISCEEVEEAGKYDNWRERGEAFVDSIKRLTGENYVATADRPMLWNSGNCMPYRRLQALLKVLSMSIARSL